MIFEESKDLIDSPVREALIISDKDFQKLKQELSPILFLLNIIGFFCFLLLFSANINKLFLKR